MKNKKRIKSVLLIALLLNAGNIVNACEAAGISTDTYYRWKRTDKDFEKSLCELEEKLLAQSLTHLRRRALVDRSTSALIGYAKLKSKSVENINSASRLEDKQILKNKKHGKVSRISKRKR